MKALMTPNTIYVGVEVSELFRDAGGLGGAHLIAYRVEGDGTGIV
jgi:hypothetical protein